MSKVPDISNLVQQLRRETNDLTLPEEPEVLKKDETYIRFLKSRNWDLTASEKMLRKSVVWRSEFQPSTMQCTTCSSYPGAHTLRQVGFDEAGRPVIWVSFYPSSRTQKHLITEALTHLIFVIENAVRSMTPGVTQWVFIIDCAGMTAQTCHPRLGYDCAQLMSNHYPERLGLAICIRPGPVFKVAWQAIKPFLPQTTVAKVTMVNNKSQLKNVLEQHFSPSMIRWIQTEYTLNRQKPTYLRYRNFYCPSTDPKSEHDPRGEISYVRDWIEQKHPSGYQPHPNMSEFLTGKLRTLTPSSSFAVDGNGFTAEDEDEEVNEMDEADARKLMASLPDEFQIPANAQKFI